MRFNWGDYARENAGLVNSWLDDGARASTGGGGGWDAHLSCCLGESGAVNGVDFWVKLISDGMVPVAALALGFDGGVFIVSKFIVAPELRGAGIGRAVLRELTEHGAEIIGRDIERARAVIYPSNKASQRAFTAAGFFRAGVHPDGDALYYDYIKPMPCYCGHDCSRCLIYLATIYENVGLRERSRKFYREMFGLDILPEQIRCLGARSGEVFYLCGGCPWMRCCREHELDSCSECGEYPCPPLAGYAAKYVNKYNQRIDGEQLC